MSAQEWECLVVKKVGDDVSGDFAINASGMPDDDRFGGFAQFSDNMNFYTGDQAKFDANWFPNNTVRARGNPSTNVIDFTYNVNSTNGSIAFDLWSHGIFPSDTNWTLRFKLNFSTLNVASNTVMYIGLSSENQSQGSGDIQDGIFLKPRFALTGRDWRFIDTNGTSPNSEGAGDLINSEDPAISTDYFCEIKRTSATTFECTIFTDSNYSVVRFKGRNTTVVGVVNLRYVKILNFVLLDGGSMIGTVDDVQFFNNTEGTTSEFVLHGDEDLEPFVPFSPGVADFTEDFSAVGLWSVFGSVTISGGKLNGWGVDVGQNNRAFYDLQANNGITLSDTNWVADYEIFVTASGIPGHRPFLISQNTATIDPVGGGVSAPVIMMGVQDSSWGSGTRHFALIVEDANNVRSTNFPRAIPFDLNTTYFLRLQRLSSTKVKLSAFFDSARTNHIPGSPSLVEFDFPDVIDLKVIQSANAPVGGPGRTLTGTLDNIAIYNNVSESNSLILNEDFSTYGVPVNPDFIDVFDSFDWTSSNTTRVRIEDDQGFAFAMSPQSQLTKVNMTLDLQTALGGAIDADEWVLRFKMANVVFVQGGDNTSNQIGFALSSEDFNSDPNNLQNFIQFASRANAIQTLGQYTLRAGQNLSLRDTGPGDPPIVYEFNLKPLPMTVLNSLLFVELTRLSSTTAICKIYANSSYSDLIESSGVQTIPNALSLRFLNIWAENTDGTANGQIDQTFDDVQFWNGRSTTCDPFTGLGIATKTITGADDANWVQTGSNVTISGGIISGWGPDGSVQGITYDLQTNDGFTMDDTKWTAEFKFELTAFATSSGHFIFALVDTAGDITGSDLYASIFIHKQSGPDPTVNAVLRVNDGVTSFLTSPGIGIQSFTNTDLFFRLERLSITQFKLSVAFDLGQLSPLPGSPVTLTEPTFSNIVGLDHIQSRTSTGGSSSRNITGTLQDMKIYNGQVASTIPWVSTDFIDAFVDPCAETIQYNYNGDGSVEGIFRDLLTPVSNQWVFREKVFFGNPQGQPASDSVSVSHGLSDTATGSSNVNVDGLFFEFRNNATLTPPDNHLILGHVCNNTIPLDGGSTAQVLFTKKWLEGETLFIEIIRESDTLVRFTLFSDSSYTFPIESNTVAIPADVVNGLQFVQFSGRVLNRTGKLINTIDDVKIWDGVDVADSFDARRYLQVLTIGQASSGSIDWQHRYNLDDLGNYANRQSFNGSVDTSFGNETFAHLLNTNSQEKIFGETSIYNSLSDEKLAQTHVPDGGLFGAGNAPNRIEVVSKWANEITKISRISIVNTDTGIMDTDSEGVVFGSE